MNPALPTRACGAPSHSPSRSRSASAAAPARTPSRATAPRHPSATRVVVPAQPASSTSTADSLTQLYKQDAPGVVDITVQLPSSSGLVGRLPVRHPRRIAEGGAEGTGFEIDSKGNILTAEHVVSGATSIKVTFQDGSTAKRDARRQATARPTRP